MFDKLKDFKMIVKNVELNWTSVTQPNAMSGKYTTDFYFTDAKAQDALIAKIEEAWNDHKGSFKGNPQSLGYSETEDGKIKFKATQAPQSHDGKYTFEVGVFDAKATKLDKSDIPAIGNGTIANVDFEIYPYTFKNNKGVKLNLKNIQIIKLVEYGNSVDFEEEEGFTSSASGSMFSDTTAPSVEGV